MNRLLPARRITTRPRTSRIALDLGVLALTAGLLAGCGSGTSSDAPAAGTGASMSSSMSMSSSPMSSAMPGSAGSSTMAQSATTIHISSFRYDVPTSVAPGATVSVMNMDSENHTVTADSGAAFAVTATAGSTVTFTAPSKPGSYPFHCTFHANMHGVLVVS